MAYETKVILTMLARKIAEASSLKDAYDFVATAASVEGVKMPGYDELRKQLMEQKNEKQ
jgi:hypothetical protein